MASSDGPETDDLLRPPQYVFPDFYPAEEGSINAWNAPGCHRSEPEPQQRLGTEHTVTTTYTLKERTYQQQFSDIYFLRLSKLKPAVEEVAAATWRGVSVRSTVQELWCRWNGDG